jgi:hypothetical protein
LQNFVNFSRKVFAKTFREMFLRKGKFDENAPKNILNIEVTFKLDVLQSVMMMAAFVWSL